MHVLQPLGHTQAPPVQMVEPVQTFPQPPQLVASVLGSTQAPEQVMVPDLHTQVPAVQSSPEVHPLPHAPQFS